MVTILTKSAGILEPVASLLGWIMTGIFEFFNLFGIQNIALLIIIFTFIVRALMLPLTIKQQKFTKLSARMNPELQKIQAKYKGKKDSASLQKQQIETQALYAKFGANPTSGCLPILITLPLMFALYQVINNIPAYVSQIRDMYEVIATQIKNTPEYGTVLKKAADTMSGNKVTNFDSIDNIINVLAHIGTNAQTALANGFPELTGKINNAYDNINSANNFFGMNITNTPGWGFPGILVPIIAALLSFVQSKQIQVKTKDSNKDNPAASAMNSMTYVMPIMQFFFCVTFPLGIGIYWIATSVFTILQQYFVNRVLDRMDVDQLIEKSVAKAAKKKPKTIANIEANGTTMSLQDLAKRQTKNIESTVSEKDTSTDKAIEGEKQEISEDNPTESIEEKKPSTGKQSISEIANLLKNKKI